MNKTRFMLTQKLEFNCKFMAHEVHHYEYICANNESVQCDEHGTT